MQGFLDDVDLLICYFSLCTRYLSLIENAENLACLKSNDGDVISLPPVTNSESSKVIHFNRGIFTIDFHEIANIGSC